MFGLGRHHDGKIRRVLIVEDEPLVAFDNEHILHEAGYAIVATVDVAADALKLIAAGGIDLVLTDVTLRGPQGGVDVAKAAHGAGIPAMFVSGACPIEARQFAVGCLAKPFSARDLLDAIDAVAAMLGGKRSRRMPRAFTLYGE